VSRVNPNPKWVEARRGLVHRDTKPLSLSAADRRPHLTRRPRVESPAREEREPKRDDRPLAPNGEPESFRPEEDGHAVVLDRFRESADERFGAGQSHRIADRAAMRHVALKSTAARDELRETVRRGILERPPHDDVLRTRREQHHARRGDGIHVRNNARGGCGLLGYVN
jgi:hypothetical protein